jgi:hypothetical protein
MRLPFGLGMATLAGCDGPPRLAVWNDSAARREFALGRIGDQLRRLNGLRATVNLGRRQSGGLMQLALSHHRRQAETYQRSTGSRRISI